MAIEAPLSKFKKNNKKIFIAVLLGLAVWFAYDGYFNETFIEKYTKDGVPDGTLVFNQKAPYFMVGAAVLLGISLFIVKNKKIVADDNNLIACKTTIPYDSIEKIDKTNFDTKGYFVITYKDDSGKETDLKLNDRTYDNLPAILDELIAQIS